MLYFSDGALDNTKISKTLSTYASSNIVLKLMQNENFFVKTQVKSFCDGFRGPVKRLIKSASLKFQNAEQNPYIKSTISIYL